MYRFFGSPCICVAQFTLEAFYFVPSSVTSYFFLFSWSCFFILPWSYSFLLSYFFLFPWSYFLAIFSMFSSFWFSSCRLFLLSLLPLLPTNASQSVSRRNFQKIQPEKSFVSKSLTRDSRLANMSVVRQLSEMVKCCITQPHVVIISSEKASCNFRVCQWMVEVLCCLRGGSGRESEAIWRLESFCRCLPDCGQPAQHPYTGWLDVNMHNTYDAKTTWHLMNHKQQQCRISFDQPLKIA